VTTVDVIQDILNRYGKSKNEPFGKHETATLLRDTLPDIVSLDSKLGNEYLVAGSPGAGRWSEVPWLCVFDRAITTSAQRGYYIVYLFRADQAGVYLSLNQGWTQYEQKFGSSIARDKIKANAETISNLITSTLTDFSYDPIDLGSNADLPRGYRLGHICGKYYSLSNLPSNDVLISDLRNMIGVYRELKGRIGNTLENLEILDEDADLELPVLGIVDEELESEAIKAKTPDEINSVLAHFEKKLSELAPRQKKIYLRKVVRNSTIVRLVKEREGYFCQVCKVRGFEKKGGGLYAEAHHIAELGLEGRDLPSNLICVCPTCHKKIHFGKIS
jgi:5-methylcytosine-specific restriction protein A